MRKRPSTVPARSRSGSRESSTRRPASRSPPGSPRRRPSGFSKEVGTQFVTLLRPDRPILSDLVEAMDDPQKEVKRMAVYALGAIGSNEQVVEVASRKEDPGRSTERAVEVLRTGLAQGGRNRQGDQGGPRSPVPPALVGRHPEADRGLSSRGRQGRVDPSRVGRVPLRRAESGDSPACPRQFEGPHRPRYPGV